jgi:O-glycosyl hydrolase
MHHRIMVRRERESKSEIAGFGGFNLPFPAISNRLESEKETPAQSLRTLFMDDELR